ncbi:MAG: sulfate ABC transporter substrate-binding protein [Synechococcales cyanobacterium]
MLSISRRHLLALLGGTALWAGCGGDPSQQLTVVSYAVTRSAYDAIIPLFAEYWLAQTGRRVDVFTSFGGSGSQTRAVIDGLDADVAALALALDMQRIEAAGEINPGWENELPYNSMVTHSVAVIVTRPGNPKNIRTWEDLAQPGIQVVTANPKTSGGARWNFLALWGAFQLYGGSPEQALDLTTRIYQNVGVLPRDAREATDVFFQKGQGDALITYENEVLLARLRGQDLPYVLPDRTISIDNPVAVIDANVARKTNQELVEAFVQFLFTPAAQREFAKVGFRPVVPDVAAEFAAQFPPVQDLFTVDDLGGWATVQRQFFADRAIFDQIQAQL